MLLYVDQPPPESGDGATGESEPAAPQAPTAPAGSDAPAAAGGGEAGDAR
jgi:hypothetical protein